MSASKAVAYLVQDQAGREVAHRLRQQATIGRGQDADIQLEDEKLSRQHIRVFRKEGQWWLQDLNSRNGSFVNHKQLGQAASEITHGDVIRIGSTELRFSVDGPEEQGVSALSTYVESNTTIHTSALQLFKGLAAHAGVLVNGERTTKIRSVNEVCREVLDTERIGVWDVRHNDWLCTPSADLTKLCDSTRRDHAIERREPVLVSFDYQACDALYLPVQLGTQIACVLCAFKMPTLPDDNTLACLCVVLSQAYVGMQEARNDVTAPPSVGSANLATKPVTFGEVVTRNTVFGTVLNELQDVAASDLRIHIQGETGCGKEVLARAIHSESSRSQGPFVSVNCGAIPENLLEAELFGAVKGAYTGAEKDTAGLFRSAHGGTLFLDEIGDVPLAMQTKLLRALEEGEVRPVGATQPISVDVRVLSATHKDLKIQVQQGAFREDLYFRLCVSSFLVPPLRERLEDLSVLVNTLLARLAQDQGVAAPAVPESVLKALSRHSWPGNIRELQNVLSLALVKAKGEDTLTAEMLGDMFHAAAPKNQDGVLLSLKVQLERAEKDIIQSALAAHDGNRTHTAADLGISRRALLNKLSRFNID